MNPDTGEFHEFHERAPVPAGLVRFSKGQQVRISGCAFVIEDVDPSARQILLTAIPLARADQTRLERRSKMAELKRKMRRARKAVIGTQPEPAPA